MSQSSDFGGGVDIKELFHFVHRQALGMWRYRWIALAVAWALSVACWIGIYMLPDRFGASAQVFVDTDTLLRPLLRGLSVEKDVLNDVALMTRTMLTRPNLERVARETDLDLGTKTPREFDAVLESLRGRILIGMSGANIYTISFQDTDRQTALNVVDQLLNSFVEDSLGSGQEDSKHAERTLKQELEDYERRLTESEDRLKEFKRQNVGLMPNERGDYYAQLQAASADLAAVQQSIRVENGKAASLNSQLEGEEPVFGIMSSTTGTGGGSSIDGQIASLEKRRSDLLVEYTEKHPEVVRIDQMLVELRSKRDAEIAANPGSSMPMVTNPLDINPVYQNLKIQKSNVEVELASLRATLADKQARVEQLKKMVDVVPQVEAELNRLNRDYEVVKTRYAEMLQRWEDLQTGKRVKTGTDQGQFRIINPPFAPLDPAGPPRTLYIFGAFLASLGAGLSVAFLLNLLRPVLQESRDLSHFGFPVLGSIAFKQSDEASARSRMANLTLAGAGVALIACMGLVMALSEPASRLLRNLI